MGGTRIEADHVTGLQFFAADGGAAGHLGLGGAGHGDALLCVGPEHQAGAVEHVGSGGAPTVGGTDLGHADL